MLSTMNILIILGEFGLSKERFYLLSGHSRCTQHPLSYNSQEFGYRESLVFSFVKFLS